ncbi:SIR2 family protein [Salinibacterium sp. M195]|uniref:SIR2 family protein n=1 Tax=Salinibacterium sp. M195 TaxID=2583374 RepID=UPI001C62A968|nr:SIR2 family protein [Salinibacterium sp. M195]QYH35679.1 hypothetical protein FFT87_06760 [Salinibacterium sp. M195]
MSDVRKFLEEHLKPLAGAFLFVGAGLSRRYATLPNWEGLLREFAAYTEQPFEYYLGAAGGNLPAAASRIADDFYEIWWKTDEFKESRALHASDVKDGSSALKIEIARFVNMKMASSTIPEDLREEWALLQSATVDGVITTNYDSLLQLAFPDFEVFVGQEQLLFSEAQGIAEIYHIHGAAIDPASLVLTAADYKDFDLHNPYLAAKLLTIFVEHPVLFMGYSMGDENIQGILRNIVFALRDENIGKLQDRLIFVEWERDVVPSISNSVIVVDGTPIPVTRIKVPDFVDIFAALGARQRALSAKMVRLLKEQVYEIVLNNDPKGRLFAYSDVDADSAKDISVVFGVGAKAALVGITGIGRSQVLADVLDNPSGGYPAKEILSLHISKVGANVWYPVFKYLSEAGLSTGNELVANAQLPSRVIEHANRNREKIVLKVQDRRRKSMSALLKDHDWKWAFTHILELPSFTNDLVGLKEFLVSHADKVDSKRWGTDYAKGVVVYDYLKFAATPSEWSAANSR